MIRYDSKTALIVVDVQNDFADTDGGLYVPSGEDVIPVVNREIERARQAGALVVYTQDWHPERTPHFATDGGVWPVHCVADTWGAGFHPDLIVDGPVVRKGTGGEDGYSGFTIRDPATGEERATELSGLLRQRGVTSVVIVGLALDYCVKATALDAARAQLRTSVLADGTRAVDLRQGDGERARVELAAAGVTVV
ncbi:MAG: isochorismatase family protein [Acidobacteriota bacterium]|nr:isochorismatase family protein [Acidobacteriota bacterium]